MLAASAKQRASSFPRERSSPPGSAPEWTESSALDGVHGGLRPEPEARERRRRSEFLGAPLRFWGPYPKTTT